MKSDLDFSANCLGELADPRCFTTPPDVTGWEKPRLIEMLRSMLVIRAAEEQIAVWVTEDRAKCPCHLGIGQEAIAVGVSQSLTAADRVFGAHRSHSHYLALGGSVEGLLAEVLGKATGCSKGFGGSMHLIANDKGFAGSVPIVSATIPIAVGAALAAKMDQRGNIAVSYFGDGAAEEGVFHESMNLAAVQNLPVLFVCENNLFASHLDIGLRQPSDRVARFAKAHSIEAVTIDGNNIIEVAGATKELTSAMRQHGRPALLETVTYRWRGHVGPREDIDVGLHRKAEDIAAWKKRDPIARLVAAMDAAGQLTAREYEQIKASVADEIAGASAAALSAPYPKTRELLDAVYARGRA